MGLPAFAYVALAASGSLASADSVSKPPSSEIWAGVAARTNSWAAYTGTTFALSGSLADPGWRLRLSGGMGEFEYGRTRNGVAETYRARTTFGDALVGYHLQLGATTAKLFAGATLASTTVKPPDPDFDHARSTLGAKVRLETWTRLPANFVFKFDVEGGQLFERPRKVNIIRADALLAYEVSPDLRIGLEAAYHEQDPYRAFEAGGHVSFGFYFGSRIDVSAGYVRDEDNDGVYGRASLLFKY
ncbi:MAG: cellulose biosynthesis protein BcsS [Pseudomonadota bacterium]